ncbi:MAG: CpsB/CapC family capsule biosynthesis tyrosine phosphatase [Oceanospirillaceae bacterium]
MIDLHCHLLPGVDDGAIDQRVSIDLFKTAINDGINHMVLTPHVQPGRYENTKQSLLTPFHQLQALIREQQLDITIGIAGEVRLCAEVLGLYATDDLPFIGTWKNKKVMLLELPHNGIPPGSDKLVDWLLDRDILPMIAHPERNKAIMSDTSKVQPFIQRGCLFQLTAMSVTGKFGEQAYSIAHQFLTNNWATVVATDAHNLKHRPPILSQAYDLISLQYSHELAEQLFKETPMEIIASNEFYPIPR